MLNSKIMKKKSPFMIYEDFESILGPKSNGKHNPEEFYTSKYQKRIACSYNHKLICIDDKFSQPFKAYLDEKC